MGTVYLIGDWEKEGFFKIGVTRGNVETRMKKLQTGNGGELYLASSFETSNPFILEKMLHNRYKRTDTNNEWFLLTDEDVLNFKTVCEEYQESIDALENNYFFNKKTRKD